MEPLKALIYLCVEFLFVEGSSLLKWSETYHLKATLIIPSAQIQEPYEIWVDGKTNNARVDFYGGMDKIFRKVSEDGSGNIMYYKAYPETTEEEANKIHCEEINDNTSLNMTYLPQKDFKFVDYEIIDNVKMQKWESVSEINKLFKVQIKYVIWVTFGPSSRGQNIPVPKRFEFKLILGERILQYIRHDYKYFNDSDISSDVFEKIKDLNCISDSSSNITDPLMELIEPQLEDKRMHQEFERFQLNHKKKYSNYNEKVIRKAIFTNNLRYINSMNRQHKSFTLGVNHLADLTDEELAVFLGTINKKYKKINTEKSNNCKDNDDQEDEEFLNEKYSFDWRDYGAITSVKDQTILCGSCYAFATAGVMESAAYISRGCKSLVPLSVQAIVDCTWSNEFDYDGNLGCRGGTYEYSLKWIQKHGLPTTEEYGSYLAQEGFCHMKNMTKLVPIKTFNTRYDKLHTDKYIKKILRSNGPMMVSINISPKSFQFYQSGIYDDLKCRSEESERNHGVIMIGYGKENGVPYWLIKNSWGEGWGEDGYIKIAANYNICGVKNFLNYVTFKKNKSKLCFNQ